MKKKNVYRKEDPSINFRLPKELKIQIQEAAISKNQTTSIFLRDHMESFLSGELIENELAKNVEDTFMNSTEFLQLVVWIFIKRNENEYVEGDRIWQDKYISTIKSIDNQLPWS